MPSTILDRLLRFHGARKRDQGRCPGEFTAPHLPRRPCHRLEEALERNHRLFIAEKHVASRDHLFAKRHETRAVAHETDRELDVALIRRRDQRIHSHPAEDAAAKTPPHELTLAAHTGRPVSIAWITVLNPEKPSVSSMRCARRIKRRSAADRVRSRT
jgi:hypothetical protein